MTGRLAAESFKTALRSLLDARGRGAQTELAEALGLSRSAINDILTGRRGTSQMYMVDRYIFILYLVNPWKSKLHIGFTAKRPHWLRLLG